MFILRTLLSHTHSYMSHTGAAVLSTVGHSNLGHLSGLRNKVLKVITTVTFHFILYLSILWQIKKINSFKLQTVASLYFFHFSFKYLIFDLEALSIIASIYIEGVPCVCSGGCAVVWCCGFASHISFLELSVSSRGDSLQAWVLVECCFPFSAFPVFPARDLMAFILLLLSCQCGIGLGVQ